MTVFAHVLTRGVEGRGQAMSYRFNRKGFVGVKP